MSQAGEITVSASTGAIDFIEGNSGGPVPPNAGNIIFLLGSGDITVTGDPVDNTLTISSSGITWNKISVSQTLATNMGYICTGGAVLDLLLPPVSNVGDIIEITLDGSSGFSITQGANQLIRYGNQSTTTGVAGSLSSTAQGDTVRMVCSITDLKWNVLSSIGNLTVV